MNKTNSDHSISSGPSQLNLVNSSRLQALRKQSIASENDRPNPTVSPKTDDSNSQEDAETTRLRTLINQRLAEIMAQLPPGKQQSLFKIRYGLSLGDLQRLPVKQIAKILKVTPGSR